MNKSIKIEKLLEEGFSKKIAKFYIEQAESELNNTNSNIDYVKWAHSKGFLAESAYAYGLDETNYTDYLSDYDYYKIWPINNWSRIWINDKLTLDLMLGDSKYKGFMPKYYYYSTSTSLKSLVDTPYRGGNIYDNFFEVLSKVGEFACKPCNGTLSAGFYRMTYNEGEYYINGEKYKKEDIIGFLQNNPNYIFTEYIRPSDEFKAYNSKIHTLRLVVLNETGDDPKIVGGYLRIPHELSGEANYITLSANKDEYNVIVNIDTSNGKYEKTKLVYFNKTIDVTEHPDTNVPICGIIKDYQRLKELLYDIAMKFSNLEFMGFDIGITNDGFKCMEINTHPGIKYMQIFNSLYENKEFKIYVDKKIDLINSLPSDAIKARNEIIR